MKLLFDENLSPRLVELLTADFPGSAHLEQALGRSRSDADIWQHAIANGYVIISKEQIFELIRSKAAEVTRFGESLHESLLVLTP